MQNFPALEEAEKLRHDPHKRVEALEKSWLEGITNDLSHLFSYMNLKLICFVMYPYSLTFLKMQIPKSPLYMMSSLQN